MLLAPVLFAFAVGGGLWLVFAQPNFDDGGYDEHLCPTAVSGPTGLVALLFDLTKPLVGLPAGLPRQLLRDLTLEVERDTEIRAYLLTGTTSAPRVLLKRLCKPFDTDAVQVATAKDHHGGTRDCGDLPAQMASGQRRSASRFCELRETLASRLDALAERASEDRDWEVAGSHLVEALEQTRADLLSHGGSRRVLHVVSDMVQHAGWYSHLDLPFDAWNYDGYAQSRDSRGLRWGRWEGADIDVHIHYTPRAGLTAEPRAGDSHRRFWRRFFGSETVTFHDQPPLRAYASMPLMDPGILPGGASTPRAPLGRRPVEEQVSQLPEAGAFEPSARVRPVVADREAPELPPPDDSELKPAQLQKTVSTGSPPPEEAEQHPAPASTVTSGTASGAAYAVASRPEPDAPPDLRPAPLPDSPIAASAVEDAPRTWSGTDGQMEGAAQAHGDRVAECSQQVLLEMLAQEGNRWRPQYPRGGFRDFGDAQLAVRYFVNDKGEVEREGIQILEEKSVLERPGYIDMFAQQAIATVQNWRFRLNYSDDRACAPRSAGYEITLQFQF